MIEIEFSALSRQCLNRRIPSQEKLTEEIQAIIEQRNKHKIKIEWQFSIKKARAKLNNKYQAVNSLNVKFKKT